MPVASEARVFDYAGVSVRVMGPEHLVALALEAGGAKRRERAAALLESGTVSRDRLRQPIERRTLGSRWPREWDAEDG